MFNVAAISYIFCFPSRFAVQHYKAHDKIAFIIHGYVLT